jgi:hypothetical protein
MARIRFDISRLGIGELVVGGANLVLMIGVFLPWFDFGSPATGDFSFDATAVRRWMYLPLVASLVIVVYLAVKATFGEAPLPRLQSLIVLGACDASLLLTLVCFAKKGAGVNWDYGAYVSLVAAIAAVVGAIMALSRSRRMTRRRLRTPLRTG